jgi:hypothetical protein
MNRNGAEFDYFHRAYQASHEPKKRPVIGYYGAIAEWFNAEIVCRCAKRFPECTSYWLALSRNTAGDWNSTPTFA